MSKIKTEEISIDDLVSAQIEISNYNEKILNLEKRIYLLKSIQEKKAFWLAQKVSMSKYTYRKAELEEVYLQADNLKVSCKVNGRWFFYIWDSFGATWVSNQELYIKEGDPLYKKFTSDYIEYCERYIADYKLKIDEIKNKLKAKDES